MASMFKNANTGTVHSWYCGQRRYNSRGRRFEIETNEPDFVAAEIAAGRGANLCESCLGYAIKKVTAVSA